MSVPPWCITNRARGARYVFQRHTCAGSMGAKKSTTYDLSRKKKKRERGERGVAGEGRMKRGAGVSLVCAFVQDPQCLKMEAMAVSEGVCV